MKETKKHTNQSRILIGCEKVREDVRKGIIKMLDMYLKSCGRVNLISNKKFQNIEMVLLIVISGKHNENKSVHAAC